MLDAVATIHAKAYSMEAESSTSNGSACAKAELPDGTSTPRFAVPPRAGPVRDASNVFSAPVIVDVGRGFGGATARSRLIKPST